MPSSKGRRWLKTSSFPPSFRLRLARKDASLVLQAAAEQGLELPAVEAALRQLERAQEAGLGDEDRVAVAKVVGRGVREQA